jgi:hypothetical protein
MQNAATVFWFLIGQVELPAQLMEMAGLVICRYVVQYTALADQISDTADYYWVYRGAIGLGCRAGGH